VAKSMRKLLLPGARKGGLKLARESRGIEERSA
jgi:hypothetical protein